MKTKTENEKEIEALTALEKWSNQSQPFESATWIKVFTNNETKPNPYCDWFYRISEGNGNPEFTDSGQICLCECDECGKFGKHLYEYFAIFKALSMIKLYCRNAQVELFVASEIFFEERNEALLSHYSEIYNCPFLQMLGVAIASLLSALNVAIDYFNDANEEDVFDFS